MCVCVCVFRLLIKGVEHQQPQQMCHTDLTEIIDTQSYVRAVMSKYLGSRSDQTDRQHVWLQSYNVVTYNVPCLVYFLNKGPQ